MPRPQTIQIYLPTGDPRGMRVAEITTRIVRVIEVPRSQLAEFLKLPEAQQVGVYFLLGELSEAGLPRVYIGQSGCVGTRLVQHNQNKDFWNRALVVISLTNSLTQTHALFLEWFAIQQATQAGRYSLENGNAGARPHTPAPLEADCHEIFETAATLVATLGQPIFEPLTGAPQQTDGKPQAPELFYCKGPQANAVGEYTSEGFVVHKGSTTRLINVASIDGTPQVRFRQQLVTDGVLTQSGDSYVFTRDYLFTSPSLAACVVMGRSANGWLEWKTDHGQTLDSAKRQTVSLEAG
ncbi:MAG: GIY-YIG nuclease family protein [Rhodoferax sp.]|uniref:GIY-YIG nuclease family protein n=1 Tax=Rhodoferax sp. TaxID=50421 RepID=UPI0026087514|nr:GIY-YIG nuclease family protein [Rhodoferax sp.]MDD2878841.1 GIY-YIG nuclease family protein [Rhodoferax sp.]